MLSRGTGKRLVRDPLAPEAARDESTWLEQRVEVRALVDDRLVAAGTPVSVEAPSLGTLFTFCERDGARAADASPRHEVHGLELRARSRAGGPAGGAGSLSASGTALHRALGAGAAVDSGPRIASVWTRSSRTRRTRTSAPTGRCTTRPPSHPGRDVAVRRCPRVESWLRRRGGFTYNERPPVIDGPPLVNFVTTSKAGYCQHFAGAMAVMARLLGIPARVAVGFTSGRLQDGAWVVNDHDAHASVEVWFPGTGVVPFDPTSGRGTFSTSYSFASDSPETVAALRRGSPDAVVRRGGARRSRAGPGHGRRRRRRPAVDPHDRARADGARRLAIGLVKWLRRRVGYLDQTRDASPPPHGTSSSGSCATRASWFRGARRSRICAARSVSSASTPAHSWLRQDVPGSGAHSDTGSAAGGSGGAPVAPAGLRASSHSSPGLEG